MWSVMIPAYNCSRCLEQTISSVLCQDRGTDNMQICVVDDGSTDADIHELVNRVGQGRVEYLRNSENMGSLRTFEKCINNARGKLLHLLHGDDFISQGFYSVIEELFANYPHAGAAFTDFNFVGEENNFLYREAPLMDVAGVLPNSLELLACKQRIQPPSMVVKRAVYEDLGSFFGVTYGEDWEMWVRIASRYPILHSPQYLASYRVHDFNISGTAIMTGQNVADIKKVIQIIALYLPESARKRLEKAARKNFAIYYAWLAHKLYHDNRNVEAAIQQALGALSLDINFYTLLLAAKLYTKILIRYKSTD